MEEIIDDEGLDMEALQAQIDLSMAYTQNLVSSWLSSSGSTLPSSKASRAQQEQELQELLKRPSRLGVGAPIPASTSIHGVEVTKLRGKLTHKKRGREENAREAILSEEEEESRAGAIKKRARVDPFEVGKGKKKKQAQQSETHTGSHPIKPLQTGVDSLSKQRGEFHTSKGKEVSADPSQETTPQQPESQPTNIEENPRVNNVVTPTDHATEMKTTKPDQRPQVAQHPSTTHPCPLNLQPLIANEEELEGDSPKKKRKRKKGKKPKQGPIGINDLD